MDSSACFKWKLGGVAAAGAALLLVFLGVACEPTDTKPVTVADQKPAAPPEKKAPPAATGAAEKAAPDKAAPEKATAGAAAAAGGKAAKATIEGKSGSKLTGEATFAEVDGSVKVMVHVLGAPPGKHAVHIHEKGDCSAADGMSAGGHFNPGGHQHGAPDAKEHHAGDFGNMEVAADGHGMIELTSKDLTVKDGPNSVVGRAIIIHEKEDDLKTQPTGAAGGRIGCGVIQAQ